MLSTRYPLVSVIIPFLNGGQWLAEAVESVITQSYSHWEIILVDDGSDEQATNIAKEYCIRESDKIIYADHPGHANKGVTVSRNAGVRLSKGEFIAFLDADDCWLPAKLLHQVELFKQHPETQMICEASKFWYSWNDRSKEDVIVNVGVEPNRLYHPPRLIKSLYPLGAGAPPCPTGIMITREALMRSEGFEEVFTGDYQLYEDQAFLSKIYLSENVYVSGIANNLYRKRPGSLTESGNDEKHYKKVRLFFLSWLEEYIQKQHVKDETLMQLISDARIEMNS